MTYTQSHAQKKDFKLPMVPGMSCGEEMLRRNYHRAQGLTGASRNKVMDPKETFADMTQDNLHTMGAGTAGGYTNTIGDQNANGTVGGAKEALSGRVLRFYGYTVEAVPESSQETERVRKATFNYFLEDNTMSVVEPREDNSGIGFNASLKRHIVPFPDGTPIHHRDIRIGEPLTFYGKTYMICDADPFTRDYYNSAGAPLPDAISLPIDEFTKTKTRPIAKAHDVRSIAATSPLNIALSAEQVRKTQQFLAHDRKVLRCDCTWDDGEALYGTKHYMTLYYFLSDGSIAVVEKDTPNSGRDPFPNFFRRQRIMVPTDAEGRFDSEPLGSLTFKEHPDTVYYTDRDIRIGKTLNLFGRKVFIHGYDQYTKDYLSEKFGVENHTLIPGGDAPVYVPVTGHRREVSKEDLAEASRHNLEDLRRQRRDNQIVKFQMQMDNGKYEDEIRRFVLGVYPSDNTITIYEPVIHNSGIVGGKFLQRQAVLRPDGKEFTADDFYVGARVVLNCFPFIILTSDTRSLNYMELNKESFSRSNINTIVRKMQAMLRSKQTGLAAAFSEADKDNAGGLDIKVLLGIVEKLKLDISEQEFLTVLRYFDQNNESYVTYEEVASRILPEGTPLGSDDRPWEDICTESVNEETAAFVQDSEKLAAKQRAADQTARAARGTQEFLELYDQRRQLFSKEFHSIIDYAKDNLVGVDEFKMCLRKKLHIASITDDEMNALCEKLFPSSMPRLTIEELMRVFNDRSSLPRNLAQIARGVSQ